MKNSKKTLARFERTLKVVCLKKAQKAKIKGGTVVDDLDVH